MPKPDLYVYLHASTNKLIKNIKNRGRDYEQNIEAEYLEKINKGYFQYFSNTKSFPILVIDIDDIDFLQNDDHFQLLMRIILKSDYKLGQNRLIL